MGQGTGSFAGLSCRQHHHIGSSFFIFSGSHFLSPRSINLVMKRAAAISRFVLPRATSITTVRSRAIAPRAIPARSAASRWYSATTLAGGPGGHTHGSLAADGTGRLWVFWTHSVPGGPHVFARRLGPAGLENLGIAVDQEAALVEVVLVRLQGEAGHRLAPGVDRIPVEVDAVRMLGHVVHISAMASDAS